MKKTIDKIKNPWYNEISYFLIFLSKKGETETAVIKKSIRIKDKIPLEDGICMHQKHGFCS